MLSEDKLESIQNKIKAKAIVRARVRARALL